MSMNIALLQQQLEDEKEKIKHDLYQLGIQNPKTPEDWLATPADPSTNEADQNVVADRAEEWQTDQATVDALESRLGNINLALDKIATGRYGICEISGEPIEEDRLEANPAARTNKAHMNDESTLPR